MRSLQTPTAMEKSLMAALPEGSVKHALSTNGLPSRRSEGWRWSDLRAALRDVKEIQADYQGAVPTDEAISESSPTLTFANGQLVNAPSALPDGVRLAYAQNEHQPACDIMPALAMTLAEQSIILHIDKTVSQPLHIRYLGNGNGLNVIQLRMKVATGVHATLLETHEYDGTPFINGVTHLEIAEQASVHRVIIQKAADEAGQLHTSFVTLQTKAAYTQSLLGFGGHFTRFETILNQAGDAGTARLNTAYLLNKTRHFDATTRVSHGAINGVTRQLTKGIVRDKASAVFQGKFFVAKGAQKTDADMQHKALLLTGDGQVNAKPELEIYADDVECAHGNSVGALDEEIIFYMKQRGLSDHQARAMLVEAFVGEVFEDMEEGAFYPQIFAHIRNFMDGGV